jgi:hypothetical protein
VSEPKKDFSNKWMTMALVFIVLSIILASTTVYFYYQYNALEQSLAATTVQVNLGLGSPNTGIKWFNKTVLVGDSNLYDAMVKAGWNITYKNYGLGEGYFITAINSVKNNPSNNTAWLYWVYTGPSPYGCWQMGPVAANAYFVQNNETFVWYYEAYNATTGQAPPPPC